MYKNNTVAVVVTAYNEEEHVGQVIDEVPEFVDRIYAVDDGSTDDTWNEIKRHTTALNATRSSSFSEGSEAFEPIAVSIRHETNRGVGGAIKSGYLHAREDGMDVTAVLGGDGQMDPGELPRLLDPIVEGEADYAKGNRLRKPEYRESMSGWRLFGNTVLTFLTKAASGYWGMMDPQNGYTAISREAIETIDLDSVYRSYGFCNDMLVRLNVHRFTIADVEMPAIYGEETSHIEYRTFVPQLSMLLARQFLWRLRSRFLGDGFHPAVGLYGLGAAGLLAGVGHGVSSLKNVGKRARHGRLAIFEFLMATILLLVGIAFDKRDSENLEVRE
jgi:glycosyltransferase involved in cell wall biosynthesis